MIGKTWEQIENRVMVDGVPVTYYRPNSPERGFDMRPDVRPGGAKIIRYEMPRGKGGKK